MAMRRRTAKFDAILVYMDEPQVITLIANKTRIIAVAIPQRNERSHQFIATSLTDRDWLRYLDGTVDLRYLFTVPTVRTTYHLDLAELKDGKVTMYTWEGSVAEKYLPSPRFFSTNHTHPYESFAKATDPERLFIDGEWELTDFGQFQHRFADIYSFVSATKNLGAKNLSPKSEKRILDAFQNRPFQGGFSYVHLFNDLSANVPRAEQLNLNEIQYASPGYVEVFGKQEVFSEMELIIRHFNDNRADIQGRYSSMYKFLSENRYLRLTGYEFGFDNKVGDYINGLSSGLCAAMMSPDFLTVQKVTRNNALVCAKVVLAFYRRLSEVSLYFVQGRISYAD